MNYKERLRNIDTNLQNLINTAKTLKPVVRSYTVTLTGTGGYYDDMAEMSILDYSLDGGKTWVEVFDGEGRVVTKIKDAKQIQFRISNDMFMICDFYMTMCGERILMSVDTSGNTWYTQNVTLIDDAVIDYTLG